MNFKDLRIGNWLLFDTDNGKGPMQIESIRSDKISAGFQVVYYDDDEDKVEPIPLTPEILEKADFKKGLKGFWMKGGVEYNLNESILDGFGHCDIKYIHQLQNLYFALTGEELQLRL